MNVTENGVTREMPLGAAAYAKNDASYIPVRAVADALGLRVFWDNNHKTVVIINMEKLIADVDKEFTVLNSLMGMPVSQIGSDDGVYKTVMNMLMSMTMFDSLDGDRNVDIEANMSIITDGRNFSFSGTIDLSKLMDLYDDYDLFDEEELQEIEETLGALDNVRIDIIFNYDDDMIYFKAPFLNMLDPDFPADAWISVAGLVGFIDEIGLDDLLGSMIEIPGILPDGGSTAMTVGRMIVNDFPWYRRTNQIHFYEELMESVITTKAIVGDGRFVKNGNNYTLTVTLRDLYSTMGEEAGYIFSSYMFISEFDLNVTITTNGSEITSISGKFVYRQGSYYSATRYYIELDIRYDSMFLKIELHEKNSQRILIEIDSKTTESETPVPKAPPAGEKVIPIEELIGDVLGSLDPTTPVPY